jgi:hypothetical protein
MNTADERARLTARRARPKGLARVCRRAGPRHAYLPADSEVLSEVSQKTDFVLACAGELSRDTAETVNQRTQLLNRVHSLAAFTY